MSTFIPVTYAGDTALVNIEQICFITPLVDGAYVSFSGDADTLKVSENVAELAALIAKTQDTRELQAFPDEIGGEA